MRALQLENCESHARSSPSVLVIHGGAGTISRASITPEKEAAFRRSLGGVLTAGGAQLAAGASSLEVVVAAVAALEDDPLFNAGHGAVFTSAGAHELDAAVMVGEGPAGRCGAVACTTRVRNPVRAAKLVMERGAHVLLAGAGADAFAEAAGCAMVENRYFSTAWREEQLAAARADGTVALDHGSGGGGTAAAKMGTVGAVALDACGRLAAATSTGGMTNKSPGRVGDSPLCGAGTYASGRVAVSCTGTGEAFIRLCAAKDVAARVEYGGQSVGEAAEAVVGALAGVGGSGGLIAVGSDGAVAAPFSSEGMYRGVVRVGAAPIVDIWEPSAPYNPPPPASAGALELPAAEVAAAEADVCGGVRSVSSAPGAPAGTRRVETLEGTTHDVVHTLDGVALVCYGRDGPSLGPRRSDSLHGLLLQLSPRYGEWFFQKVAEQLGAPGGRRGGGDN